MQTAKRRTVKWTRPHDVEREHNRVVEAMVSNDPKIRIAVTGLHKVFGSKRQGWKSRQIG